MWKEAVVACFGLLVRDLKKRNRENQEEVPNGLLLNQGSVPGLPELETMQIFSAIHHGS